MQAAELFEPGEYLDQRGPGYFTVAAQPAGQWRENSYALELLPTVVELADRNVDTYITQATFETRNRRALNVRSVGLLFADLDTYRSDGLKGKTPETQAELLVAYCRTEGVAVPSLIMFSGRGLQPKWFLTEALGAANLPDWNAAQLALVNLLEPFASDHGAKDIARVLRLDHTVNTKSGEYCRVVYTASGVDGVIARYDFTELYENLTGRERGAAIVNVSQTTKSQARVPTLGNKLGLTRLNWYRLFDIRDLWKLRGGVPEGFREVTLFWELNFLLLADPVRSQDLWKECEVLASEIDGGAGWYRNSDLGTVYRKAKAMMSGEAIEYQGRVYPALYTPRNATLLELFGITSEEETNLRTIISNDEKYRRKVERRRAAGMLPRTVFGDVKPWEAQGISRAWWYRMQAQEQGAGVPDKIRDTPSTPQILDGRGSLS